MATARETSKQARMLKIKRAAERILERSSIRDVTMEEVAAEAGVGSATLFRYVGSKDALLLVVYGDRMDLLLAHIEARDLELTMSTPSEAKDADYYLRRIMEMYKQRCDFYIKNPENAAIYLRAGFDKDNPSRWRNLAQGDRTIRLCANILYEATEHELTVNVPISWEAVARNCHAIYMHEIDRTPTREVPPESIWGRAKPRLEAQLLPLFKARRAD